VCWGRERQGQDSCVCVRLFSSDDDDCFYYYKKWFSTLDSKSMRSNLGIKICDYQWFAFTSFAFLFRKEKYVKEKNSQSKISSRLLTYIYTCVLFTHIRTYVRQNLVYLDSSGPLGVSSRLLGSHPSTCAVCVCMCVCTHSYTHTLPPALKIDKTQTTPLSFLLSKNSLPRQATSALID